MKPYIIFVIAIIYCHNILAQRQEYFQQRVSYNIKVKLKDSKNIISGTQDIFYYNNSKIDTLYKIYFHLYWNAFHPNSMMDVRSLTIKDPDPRLGKKISRFTKDEEGYQKVSYITVNNQKVKYIEHETILEVMLNAPLFPQDSIHIETQFEAQIPKMVRRGGRDDDKKIQYSMSQWYPKICEFDKDGWHLNPYIMREFYGVWGDYNVEITAPKEYIVPAGGILVNSEETPLDLNFLTSSTSEVTWKYVTKNVHDFVWAADKKYQIEVRKINKNLILKFFFKEGVAENKWIEMADKLVQAYPFIKETFGEYPYPEYSFIQGGDGGMEYPMATLIKSHSLRTAVHEWMHSWFQMLLATNELWYAWMDEGFTSYTANRVMAFLNQNNKKTTSKHYYETYYAFIKKQQEEPLTTHADHFITNRAYAVASYVKGAIFLDQLGYIVGDRIRDSILKTYYYTFRYTHPNVDDFFRLAERISGFNLKWYKENWIFTTKTIDYSIALQSNNTVSSTFLLKREQEIPMPIDILVTLKNDSTVFVHIPLYFSFARKKENPYPNAKFIIQDEEAWISSDYNLVLPYAREKIKSIEIDPTGRMADINRLNNRITF